MKYPILNSLEEKRILTIVVMQKDSQFLLQEACDNYFFCILTKKGMLELAEELKALAETVE